MTWSTLLSWHHRILVPTDIPPAPARSENAFLVEEMDHFCPWTGTTIAKKNLPFFHNFLCMLMTGLVYAMVVVAVAMGNSQSIYLRGARHTGTQVRSGREGLPERMSFLATSAGDEKAEHCAMCQITTSEGNVCNEITHLNPTVSSISSRVLIVSLLPRGSA